VSKESRYKRWMAKQQREAARRAEAKRVRQEKAAKAESLKGGPAKEPAASVRAWVVALGIPGVFFSAGLAVIPFHFWLGICAAYIGAAIFLIDWWIVSLNEHLSRRLLVSAIPVAAFLLISWLAFRPAPLDIIALLLDGNYSTGEMVAGIKWEPSYSEIRLVIRNGSSSQYTNLNVAIRTDIPMAKIGSLNEFSQCKSAAELPGVIIAAPTLTRHGEKGEPDVSIPLTNLAGNQFRLYCDKIIASNTLEAVIAIGAPDANRKLKPSWISAEAEYEAYFRPNKKTITQCLTPPCRNIPLPEH
jgi:hypothetical protein